MLNEASTVVTATHAGLTGNRAYTVTMWVNGPAMQVDKRIYSEANSMAGAVPAHPQNLNPLFNIGTHNAGTDGTVDLADDLLQVAKLHALEAGVELTYVLEAAETHAAAHPGEYDVVTCMEMLEHVPDPTSVVAALGRLVRPDGHVFVSTLNRTMKAYALAILGAEYVLRLLPTGTHTYEKFIRPSELKQWSRAAGLTVIDIAGLDYDPFTRQARLTTDASVNYLVHLRRSGPAASA